MSNIFRNQDKKAFSILFSTKMISLAVFVIASVLLLNLSFQSPFKWLDLVTTFCLTATSLFTVRYSPLLSKLDGGNMTNVEEDYSYIKCQGVTFLLLSLLLILALKNNSISFVLLLLVEMGAYLLGIIGAGLLIYYKSHSNSKA